ncbi:hypothetical protein Q1695_013268 [Nippostrongylus brasiliensis]|nr:hypothetical protein Q1695_013268 [Nippostrongylus brasiliensis]
MRWSLTLQRNFLPLASQLSIPVLGKAPKRVTADEAVAGITSDEQGFCTLGCNVDTSKAAIEVATKVIAVVNPNMPRTYGNSMIHQSRIDCFVETDRELYAKPEGMNASEEEVKIGRLIADNLVDNESTLQLGIGAIPDATLLAMKNHKNLGIHTELLGDGVIDLVESGVINNSKKTVMPGKITTCFAFGTKRFYRFLHNNPMIRFGGQTDFMTAAATCYDGLGKAIIAFPSRTAKGQSKIVVTLAEGAGVVTTRGHTRYVVTEYGIASLGGKNVRQRAYELIKIAHPDDRAGLERAAFERLKCMPSP